jgi:hypothetical protein
MVMLSNEAKVGLCCVPNERLDHTRHLVEIGIGTELEIESTAPGYHRVIFSPGMTCAPEDFGIECMTIIMFFSDGEFIFSERLFPENAPYLRLGQKLELIMR